MNPSVLIVEDDPEVRSLVEYTLSKEKFKVQTAENGKQALEILDGMVPDVITLDLMLPDMDGIAVLRELKQSDQTVMIPVIVVSGKEAHEQVHQAMMAGAIDYVIKPFEPVELGLRIRTFLETLTGNSEVQPPAAGGAA